MNICLIPLKQKSGNKTKNTRNREARYSIQKDRLDADSLNLNNTFFEYVSCKDIVLGEKLKPAKPEPHLQAWK